MMGMNKIIGITILALNDIYIFVTLFKTPKNNIIPIHMIFPNL